MALTTSRNKVIAGVAGALAVAATATMLLLSPDAPPPAAVILGPQAPIGSSWFDSTQVERGKFHGRNFPAEPPASTDPALDHYIGSNYYDLSLGLAIAYQRTGDAEFQALSRKVADSWWKSPHIGSGTIRTFDTFTHTPRNASLGGLILRAMDGRPEMWDWINAYIRAQFDSWLKTRIDNPQLHYGVRDGAFMLQYATWLSKVLPDEFPLQSGGTATNGAQLRAQFLADVEAQTLNYFARLQQPDGSWRWDDHDYVDADGGHLVGVTQPFQVGLLLDSLIDVYEVTSSESVRASIIRQVTNACRHYYSAGPYTQQWLPALNVKLRGFHYFYHGGTSVNPTKYAKGDLPPDWNPTNPSDVQNQRQAIGLLVAAYGWAWQKTNDRYFLDAGNELWDSAYGDTDGIRNYMAGDAKSYNQNCRWAGSYLVWGAVSAGSPSPVASTTPTLSPTPGASESANNTRIPVAVEIIDSANDKWTRLSTGVILRNGQNTSGVGSSVLYCQRTVYAFGTDSQWYKWSSGWGAVGPIDPCGSATPTPTANPVPTPSPSTTPTPRPSPSPSPTATPTPKPSPSPSLPVCAPNQVIGDPVKCLCLTGVKNNCRCR